MSKYNSLIELLTSDKGRKSEFRMKTLQYLLLPILHLNSHISYSSMKFPKVDGGYKTSFIKKQVTDNVKFMKIVEEVYGVLSMNELRSMIIAEIII